MDMNNTANETGSAARGIEMACGNVRRVVLVTADGNHLRVMYGSDAICVSVPGGAQIARIYSGFVTRAGAVRSPSVTSSWSRASDCASLAEGLEMVARLYDADQSCELASAA